MAGSARQRLRNAGRRRGEVQRSAIGPCTKYTLFVENAIVFILGAAFTSLSAYILYLKDKKVNHYYEFLLDPACLMCLLSSIVTFMGFLGAWGALRENVFVLKTYHHTLSFLLLIQLGAAIITFVAYYDSDFQEKLFPEKLFHQAIMNYQDDLDMKNLIDNLQSEFKCCGLSNDDKGYEDWDENIYFHCNKTAPSPSPQGCSVPQSCCRVKEGQMINYRCGADIYTFPNKKTNEKYFNGTMAIYTDGCVKAMSDWIERHTLVLGGVLMGVLLPQIFIMILARNLIDAIKKQKAKW